MPKAFNNHPLRVLAAAALAAVAVIFFTLPLLALHIDADARAREVSFVASGITQAMANLMNRAASVANWDTALFNIDNHFDPAWSQAELTSATDGDIFNRIVVVYDHNDRPIFQREQAQAMPAARLAALTDAVSGLLKNVRARESVRIAAGRPLVPLASRDWVHASGTLRVGGRPYYIVACLMGTDVGQVKLLHDRAPILLLASDLQTNLLPQIDMHLLLRDAAIVSASNDPARAYLPFLDDRGHAAALFSWMPERPGSVLLARAILPLSAPIVALLLAILVSYRQSLRSAQLLLSSEARANHLAFHDGLTGLANRRMVTERLEQALAESAASGGVVSLLLLDLDRFKTINDTHGHQAGDRLLQEVARRLAGACRPGDLCARLGGDEFVIVAPDCGNAAATALAELILQRLAPVAVLQTAMVQTAASIGIGVSQAGETNAAELLRRADMALYQAKEAGRGICVTFDPQMDVTLRERREMEFDLREALQSGGLEMFYQPQYDGPTVVGLEALARWRHPRRGQVPPAIFIALAEDCGLIEELGFYALHRVFLDSRRWRNLRIAVNISARQIQSPAFLPGLARLVHETQIDPGDFELELTESLMLTHDTATHAAMSAMREMGFSLAIDDFGTGYSSLSYLTRLPINKIKIDRSFVAGLPDDPQAGVVVRAIIGLAEALDLQVIAEGVETEGQRDMLEAAGCRLIQGYLVGRPVPVDQVVAGERAREKQPVLF